MRTPRAADSNSPVADPHNFSLVLGGPLFQLLQRSHLSGGALELARRRLIVITLFAWLPLLLISFTEGNLWGGGVTMPFLRDVDSQVRFLIALPLLIMAELVVHQRMRPVLAEFLKRDLISSADRPKLDAALTSALRLRNSVTAEVVLMALVYGVGVMVVWRNHSALYVSSWYGAAVDGKWQPTVAGWWLGLVSLPLFQFLLLRWYFRIFIWVRLLWHLSRLDLRLVPTHPDRCGGLGFLSGVCFAFAPLILAQGALLAGTIANQIFFVGARLPQFKTEIIGATAIMLVAVAGPLLVFIPLLSRLKRIGLREYGTMAQRYATEFDRKWIRGGAPAGEALLGSGDIQSLADLNNSFEVVRTMKLVPFTKASLVQLIVLSLLPILPLTLTLISAEDLLNKFLKVLF